MRLSVSVSGKTNEQAHVVAPKSPVAATAAKDVPAQPAQLSFDSTVTPSTAVTEVGRISS